MKYEEFKEYVITKLQKELGNEKEVKVRKVLKNNGLELDAVSIAEVEYDILPMIYLNTYYDAYLKGKKNLQEILHEILYVADSYKNSLDFDMERFLDFNRVKDSIMFKVINSDKNKKLLEDVVSIKFLDLSIVFYLLMSSDVNQTNTMLIHHSHMETWGTTVEELYSLAMENTRKSMGFNIRKAADVVLDLLDKQKKTALFDDDIFSIFHEEYETAFGFSPMYILTNNIGVFGAATMVYLDVVKTIADMVDDNLFIIPSSVHEVLVIPEHLSVGVSEMEQTIKEVNRYELSPEEILSDHLYCYNRAIGRITFAAQ